ncbi:MAG: beta-glucosidase BglX [Saprospiraceae bacterium]|nr:beta-glucosidase BglX [Saprospiraceae bacterium]
MKKIIHITALLVVAYLMNSFVLRSGIMKNALPDKTVEQRVDSLLALMTLEEKIGQMTLFTSDWEMTGPTLRATYKEDIRKGRVGAIFNAHTAAYTKELQRLAVEETRLGIPLLFGYDVIHGYKTIFPIPLGESASWDLTAIEQGARVAAIEAAASGLHWTFAPMVDIARDPRWGRISEGAGEDTYLGSAIAVARVKGFQGTGFDNTDAVLACAKHYAAYGAAQAGRDYHTVDISEQVMREVYLPPFKAAADAGVWTFMNAFNEWNGIPATAHDYLLKDILKWEWAFPGFVVTDYTSINEMVPHGYASDYKHAGELSVNAGVDMDMQGAVYYNHLADLVREGKVKESRIDDAVRRILRMKFMLGLFEDPYRFSNAEREKRLIMAPEHLAAARDMARKSLVLLRNEKQLLPLPKTMKTLAVIGPLADSKVDMLGNWSAAGDAKDCVTLLEGIRTKLQGSTQIIYEKGCNVDGTDRTGFAKALAAAKKAQVILVAVGEAGWMSGEAASRTDISLPGVQEDLVKALIATGKPVVVVLMNGRPLTIPWIADNAPAILETWFAGTQGGHAISDVLFGDYNPSGKLPVTFPRNVGQIPLFYNPKNTGRPMNPNDKYTSKYLDAPNTPQWPFGFGLSYTTFEYSDLKTDKKEFDRNETVTISVKVANTGQYDGEETAQLYVRDLVGSVTRPVRELKGFQKVFLKKGESKVIQFKLRADDLRFYNADLQFRAEPGDFDLWVGSHSDATLGTRIVLTR